MRDIICKNNNLKVYNILRRLGFRPNNVGTEFILKAILLIQDIDATINIGLIYEKIANESNTLTAKNVRMAISYAITHRNEDKSIENFEDIFGYAYDEDIFSNKDLICEIARII